MRKKRNIPEMKENSEINIQRKLINKKFLDQQELWEQ